MILAANKTRTESRITIRWFHILEEVQVTSAKRSWRSCEESELFIRMPDVRPLYEGMQGSEGYLTFRDMIERPINGPGGNSLR